MEKLGRLPVGTYRQRDLLPPFAFAAFLRSIMSRLFMRSLLSSISAFPFLSEAVIHLNVSSLSDLCGNLFKTAI